MVRRRPARLTRRSLRHVNDVWVYLYITKAPRGHVSRVWSDDIVIATDYIGPLEPRQDAD